MSEPTVRFRKTPKTPFLVGNVLLAALGVSLVFFGENPWSLTTVLLVILCLALGGLLTLLPFLLDQFAWLNFNRSRSAQASVNLRGAFDKADELLEELQARREEENPLRLVSERLPDLVEEKLGEALERNLQKTDERPSEILRQLGPLSGVAKDLEKLRDDLRILSAHAVTREYVETGLTRLSEEIGRIETKLDEWRRAQLYDLPESAPPSESAPPPESAPVGPPDEAADPDFSRGEEPGEREEEEGLPEETDTEEDWPEDLAQKESPEEPADEELFEEIPEDEPGEENTPAPASAPKPEDEISKESPAEPVAKKPRKPKVAKVIISAFVGIQNGIYLRGDGPNFSEDSGQRLEMTGIGEWAWSAEISESFQAQIFLNDEIPSDIGTFTVTPGDVLKLNPSFPQEK